MAKGQMTAFGANLPMIMILLLVGLIILAVIVNEQYEIPKNFKQKPVTGFMRDFFLFFGIPSDWLFVPALIYLFFVPFLGIFVVVYGFLSEMEIFKVKQQINVILALLFAFATIPIGAFVKLVSLMFAVLSIYAVGAFGLLFFFGVIYVIITRMGGWSFFGEGVSTYSGLQMEHRYEQLRRWLLDTYRDQLGSPNAEAVRAVARVPGVLRKADSMRGTKMRSAVNYLQQRSARIYADLTRAGVSVSRPPR